MSVFFLWIFSVIIGCMIGASKGRALSGFVWSFLFGPLGVIVVLCLKNLSREEQEEERRQQRALELQIQQAQLHQLTQLQRGIPPPPPGREPSLRIASDGQDLGEMPVSTVKRMLSGGKLTPQDFYFDSAANDWAPLEGCPSLA